MHPHIHLDIWIRHVTHIPHVNKTCHVTQSPYMNQTCHTYESRYESAMSHIWIQIRIRHVTHMNPDTNQTCHTYESRYEYDMWHIFRSLTHIHMCELSYSYGHMTPCHMTHTHNIFICTHHLSHSTHTHTTFICVTCPLQMDSWLLMSHTCHTCEYVNTWLLMSHTCHTREYVYVMWQGVMCPYKYDMSHIWICVTHMNMCHMS